MIDGGQQGGGICRSGGGFVLHRDSNLQLPAVLFLSHLRIERAQLEASQTLAVGPEHSGETALTASSGTSVTPAQIRVRDFTCHLLPGERSPVPSEGTEIQPADGGTSERR